MRDDGRLKVKVPKRIGGVKVPKKLRKAGASLVERATSPAGLELIALGLSIASAAAANAQAKRERKPEPLPPEASKDPHEVGVALGRMAEAALAGLLRPKITR